MDRIFRKLQNISKSFYVNLPKKWILKFNLDKNSSIAIDIRNDGTLLISPKLKQDKEDLKDELVLHSSPHVVREIITNSLSGQTHIVVISDKEIPKNLRNEIRRFVNGLPNTEITEEGRQRIVIQNFGYKKIPTKKLIHRLLYLIADMFDNLKIDAIEDLKYNFGQLRKFYFILVIHIRTYLRTSIYVTEDNDFTPLEAMDYRMFCEKIQAIGKILRDLRLSESESVKGYFQEIHQYFNDVMNAYLKKDIGLAHEAWLIKEKIVKEGKSLMEKSNDCEDKDKLKDLIMIAENCKKLAALI